MTGYDRLREQVRAAVDEHGLAGAARHLDVPIGQIRSVVAGRSPTEQTISRIVSALGWEWYVGPRRDGPTSVKQALQIQKPALPPVPPRALESGLERVRDRDLAALLAAVAARWRSLPEAERRYLLSDLWAAGGSGLRAQGSGIRGAVAWLGWRVIDGGEAGEDWDG